MKKLLKLLKKLNKNSKNGLNSICVFSDKSGRVFDYKMEEIYSFHNLKQLKKYLKNN